MNNDYSEFSIFVEGADDKRFIDNIIKPELSDCYNRIDVIEYATRRKEWIKNRIQGILNMQPYYYSDYVYLADRNNSPCITTKKQKIKQQVKNIDENRIIIVDREIEGWYLAGLTKEKFKNLGIEGLYQKLPNTNKTIKEEFDKIWQSSNFSDSRIDFMQEILKVFQLEFVEKNNKNTSLEYFIRKYLQTNT